MKKEVKKVEKTKAQLVKEVEQHFGKAEGFFASLERANKEVLEKLLAV